MAIVQLRNVVKTYPLGKTEVEAVKGISFKIEKGDFISIAGPSGSGKSTLLNTLTRSSVRAENRLFATLDPTSRRKRLPKEAEN